MQGRQSHLWLLRISLSSRWIVHTHLLRLLVVDVPLILPGDLEFLDDVLDVKGVNVGFEFVGSSVLK